MIHAPALIADIGGTHARFALVDENGISRIDVLHTSEYPSLTAAAKSYLARHSVTVSRAALSIAATLSPQSEAIVLANLPDWNTTRQTLIRDLDLQTLIVVNDFEALARGIVGLDPDGYRQIAGGTPIALAPIGVIGPGTGLGMAAVVFIDGQPQIIASEGGNATLPATTAREYAIIEALRALKGDGHVSAEDAVSGTGLPRLYQAIGVCDGLEVEELDAPAITAAALAQGCPVAVEALDLFCHWLGVMAGNLALTVNAHGGIYIAGGIVPQWLDYFTQSRFTHSFGDKGAYGDMLRQIPIFVVTHPYPALEGMRTLLTGVSSNQASA